MAFLQQFVIEMAMPIRLFSKASTRIGVNLSGAESHAQVEDDARSNFSYPMPFLQ